MIVALGGVGQHARSAAGAWIADVVPGDLVLTSIFPRAPDEGIDESSATCPASTSVSPFATFDLAIDGGALDGAADGRRRSGSRRPAAPSSAATVAALRRSTPAAR